MRKTDLALLALICLLGGSVLLEPAQSQTRSWGCWSMVGTYCEGTGTYKENCYHPGNGCTYLITCSNHEWFFWREEPDTTQPCP